MIFYLLTTLHAHLATQLLPSTVLLLPVLLLPVLLLPVLPFSVSSPSVLSLTAFPSTYVADTTPKSGIRAYFLHDYVCSSWSTH